MSQSTSNLMINFLPATGDKKLAIITFDNESSLNAQNLAMVQKLRQCLEKWRHDDSIAALVLRGAGEKAFCAGGDIRGLYHIVRSNQSKAASEEQLAQFFLAEYSLVYLLATYDKPIVAWGSGIAMGGGMGILAACSHRIVTDRTVMAMPEVSIGLFPDAGASWFLPKMMGKTGLFLGLTGARIDANDAVLLNVADFMISSNSYDALLDALVNAPWDQGLAGSFSLMTKTLALFSQQQKVPSPRQHSTVLENFDAINALMQAGNLTQIDQALLTYDGDSEFIKQAVSAYRDGSAITKALAYAMYFKTQHDSLAQCLALEFNTAVNVCLRGDFAEGVRALLIDKDKNPAWKYRMQDLDEIIPEAYFANQFKVTPEWPWQ